MDCSRIVFAVGRGTVSGVSLGANFLFGYCDHVKLADCDRRVSQWPASNKDWQCNGVFNDRIEYNLTSASGIGWHQVDQKIAFRDCQASPVVVKRKVPVGWHGIPCQE
jgi:hypothetical protein